MEKTEDILHGLERIVRHLHDPDDFLDLFESIPKEALRDDPDLCDRVCRLALELNGAYYNEGNSPDEDVHDGFLRRLETLFEENDIPVRPILKEAVEALRKQQEEMNEAKYGTLDPEQRLFYENLDRYERIVGRSALKFGAEGESAYLSPDGGFVKNCMLSFVKALVYAQRGLSHDSRLWEDDSYKVNLDETYEQIRARLSPGIRVVREACEYYYSENVTVDVSDDIHLILVRAVSPKIIEIWLNKVDSGREHGKWLAPDRLSEFCGMVEHICSVYGKYRTIAGQRAAELRERFGLSISP